MSSPHRRGERLSPFRSSPANFRKSQSNGYLESPLRAVTESPSDRICQELGALLIDGDKAFNSQLDAADKQQEGLHRAALDDARIRHEEVRRRAEVAHERYLLAIAQEKARREEEERVTLEEARRKAAELEIQRKQRELQATKQQEEERKRLAETDAKLRSERENIEAAKQREAKEASERRSKEAQAEVDRKAQAEADGRERERQAQEAKTKPPAQQQPNALNTAAPQSRPTPAAQAPSQPTPHPVQGTPAAPTGLVTSQAEREATHQRYLDLHKRLKGFREEITSQCKNVPQLQDGKTSLLSTWRRNIAQACGTLAKGSAKGNGTAMRKVVDTLENAVKYDSPQVDMSQFIISANPPVQGQGSGILVFLLNHFAKSIVGRMIEEAARDPEMAEPLGIMVVTVFARPTLAYQGHSLIDLLWAKYHRVCPILFGISGDESTSNGRARIGWWKEGAKYVPVDTHYDRMQGLAVGFAAVTLRNFSKAKTKNPAPNRIFWEALARLTNTPTAELQPTHFYVVRMMLRQHIPRILSLYGKAGLAAVRHALVTFPQRGVDRGIDAAGTLQAQAALLRQELHLQL